MKKLLMLLLLLSVIYFCVQFVFEEFNLADEVNYQIKYNDITVDINELYVKEDNYELNLINLSFDDINYSFSVFQSTQYKTGIIKNLDIYKDDELSCVNLTFKSSIEAIDIMCKKDNVIYYYNDLENKSNELIEFVNSLENYDATNFTDKLDVSLDEYPITLYNTKIDATIIMANYNGLYLLENDMTDIILTETSFYNFDLTALVDNKYIQPIIEEGKITNINIVNINNQKVEELIVDWSTSTYMQGIVENKIYYFDKESRIQYELNVSKNTVSQVGSSTDDITFYNDGEWETIEAAEAVNTNLYFNYLSADYKNDHYYQIDQIGEENGVYYLYELEASTINVYKANISSPEEKTYLFSENKIEDVIYIDGYIFYKSGDQIKYYSDQSGVTTLLINKEFNFNDLYFNIKLN
ncbi:MAG: hypothetical protein R3Y21_01720 [Mycoplasmatota bacterium]